MKDILIEIDRLAAEELERANTVHPIFHSDHEGESVIREEIEEMADNVADACKNYNELKKSIREHDEVSTRVLVDDIKCSAQLAAAEAVQVVAMCDKFVKSKEERG